MPEVMEPGVRQVSLPQQLLEHVGDVVAIQRGAMSNWQKTSEETRAINDYVNHAVHPLSPISQAFTKAIWC